MEVLSMENNELNLEELEQELYENDDDDETPPSDVIAFNELRSCADLFRMFKAGQLKIDPDFQRNIVWSSSSKTRFIDSLAKQLPIPSMCLSLDAKTDKRLMIDGLQRISTIIKFLSDDDWQLSRLDDVDTRISASTPGYIRNIHSDVYSRIENITIPITVLRCDYSKKSHMNYLFTIFHRLNSGGNKLNNQEIRNCIYSGKFNDMLKELASLDISQKTFNYRKNFDNANLEKKNYRFEYEELFLRIFAFSENLSSYKGKLATFLNEYMESKRNINKINLENLSARMIRVLTLLYKLKANDKDILQRWSRTIIEAILYGMFKNIEEIEILTNQELIGKIRELRANPLFSQESLKEGLASRDKVMQRLRESENIFKG